MSKEKETDLTLKTWLGKVGGFIPLVSFLVMIITVVVIQKQLAIEDMIVIGVIAVSIGMFFMKDWEKYWGVVRKGLTNPSVGLIIQIYMLSAIFSSLISVGNLAGGLIWFGNLLNLKGAIFTTFVFIASSIMGVGSGTSMGTWAVIIPAFYPAGIILGANPLVLAGAIISGGAFGDNVSPISDTTIISASTQDYNKQPGFANIGDVVGTRMKYSLPAFAISIILFMIFGGGGKFALPATEAESLLAEYSSPKSLLLLIPIIVVIGIAIKTAQVGMALIIGSITTLIVAIPSNLFTLSEVWAEFPKEISGFFSVSIMFMIIMGIMQVMDETGAMGIMIDWITANLAKSAKSAEIIIWFFVSIMDIILVGSATRSTSVSAPLVNSLGKEFNIHPNRRADMMDSVATTASYILPFGVLILFASTLIEMVATKYPFITAPSRLEMATTVFYPWALWAVTLFSVITGYGRTFEGEKGEEIKNK